MEYNANIRGRKAGNYILYARATISCMQVMARNYFTLVFVFSNPEKGHTEIKGKSVEINITLTMKFPYIR